MAPESNITQFSPLKKKTEFSLPLTTEVQQMIDQSF